MERLEKSWRNRDQFRQEEGGPAFPRRVEWQDGQARHVGGSSGDNFDRRAPKSGFFPCALGRFAYNFGTSSLEPQQPRLERDPRFGFEPFSSNAPPFHRTYEQIARHWFSSYPSVGPFAHPFDH